MSVQSDDPSPDNDHDQTKDWSKFMARLLHLLPNADFGTHSTSYTQVRRGGKVNLLLLLFGQTYVQIRTSSLDGRILICL